MSKDNGPQLKGSNGLPGDQRESEMKQDYSGYLKYVSLVVLTIQNALLILWMRDVDVMFISSTAVVCAEVCKCIISLLLLLIQEKSFSAWLRYLQTHLLMDPMDNLKMSVPSLIYTLQNNLQYVGVSNLDAATYQVSYQLKILTTALFSVAMLKKQLSRFQWISLVVLFVGISVVQLQASNSSTSTSSNAKEQNWWVGITAVVVSCLMSGFAGVYFEKILKESKKSVWLRNVQLGFLGSLIGLVTVHIKDGSKVGAQGFFSGYDWAVYLAIIMQSLGGLMVAVVVKYADNILKGFATSAAIVLSCIAAIFFMGFVLTVQFVIGAGLVIASVYMYSAYPAPPAQPPQGASKV